MEKIICPECGIELESDVKECTNCGYPLDDEYTVFKRKEWKAIKWLKYGIVSSFVVIILFALILHIVGCHNKKERSEKGYARGLVPCNARGTNEFKDKKSLAYLINFFMHPDIKQFVKHYPIEFDDDLCALSTLLQEIYMILETT